MNFSFICKGKTRLKIREDTVKNTPILSEMQTGNADRSKKFTDNPHSKSGTFISMYTAMYR